MRSIGNPWRTGTLLPPDTGWNNRRDFDEENNGYSRDGGMQK